MMLAMSITTLADEPKIIMNGAIKVTSETKLTKGQREAHKKSKK